MSCSEIVGAVHRHLLSLAGFVSWPDLQHSQLVQQTRAAHWR